jgi:hypothetical protein
LTFINGSFFFLAALAQAAYIWSYFCLYHEGFYNCKASKANEYLAEKRMNETSFKIGAAF